MHTGEAGLARGDRVEDRGVGVVDGVLAVEQLGEVVGEAVGQRDLDEHDRLVDQRGMEERVAALVTVEPVAQVVPAGDGVHGLGRHEPLEHRRGRVPGDLAQFEQPDVEQRRQVTGELVVRATRGRDRRLRSARRSARSSTRNPTPCGRPVITCSHAAYRGITARRRSRSAASRSGRGARDPEAVDGAVERRGIGAELGGQRLEESTPAVEVEPARRPRPAARRPPAARWSHARRAPRRSPSPPARRRRRGQVGRDHEIPRAPQAAQETTEGSTAGRLRSPHQYTAPPSGSSGPRSVKDVVRADAPAGTGR